MKTTTQERDTDDKDGFVMNKELLCRLKKDVERSYMANRKNCERFHKFNKFAYLTQLSDNDITVNNELQRPSLEFNICEAYLSRQRGEFSKQEPSVTVHSNDGFDTDPATVKLVNDHLRHVINDPCNDDMEYDIYTDLLSGGFSVMEIFTDYIHEMSFQQYIGIRRAFDPTMCGFDINAQKSHKGDGRYCFKLYPLTKEDAKNMGMNVEEIKFTRNINGFSWSYLNNNDDILLVCDFFEKKKKRVKIVQLPNNKTMTEKKYKELIKKWEEAGLIAQAPQMMGEPRWTDIESIVRYRFTETEVIKVDETDFKILPLIWVDGNSRYIRTSDNGAVEQVTRPYIMNMEGLQRLKNYAGQSLANELENMIQHKFIVAKEAIPAQYIQAYENVQKADVLIYNAFKDNDVTIPLPAPAVVNRQQIPAEITNTFRMTDEMSQVILGSYDASLGINNNQLSGVAIQEGATQSNAAAMPYIVGFLRGLNRAAEGYVDLIPKYWKTPRTIPVMGRDGKKDFVRINENPDTQLYYEENALRVVVEAGVNFAIQKSRAYQSISTLMGTSKLFDEFMNTEGLPALLDTMEFRGSEELKESATKWMQMKKQQQAEMAKNAANNNPVMAKMQADMANIQQKSQATQTDAMIKMKQLEMEEKKLVAEIMASHNDEEIERLRAHTEIVAHMFDADAKKRDMAHNHAYNIAKHHLEVTKADRDHQLRQKESSNATSEG